MRTHATLIILLAWLAASSACSGKTSSSQAPPQDTGGSGGAAGTQGADAGPCAERVEVQLGLEPCRAAIATCGTGVCFRVGDTWRCGSGCPCLPGGYACVAAGDTSICVPWDYVGCLDLDGVSDAGGAGAAGGAGGSSASGGSGGSSETGGAGGSGGVGPCNGNPACNGSTINFCSADHAALLSCEPAFECPAVSTCTSLCPACACHMTPPVNGALDGTCDTCTLDSQCDPGLVCRDNPLYPGSGAKTCVLGP